MKRKDFVRAGVLAGLVGLCAALFFREEKFECSSRCGKCPKLEDGECTLGLR